MLLIQAGGNTYAIHSWQTFLAPVLMAAAAFTATTAKADATVKVPFNFTSSPLPELPRRLHKSPQQKYAIFAHKGHIAAIRAAIAYIWNDWLPQSGHRSAKAPMLERYPPEFDPATGLGGFELWLPLQE